MSAFKVGDFIELVSVDIPSRAANIGFRGFVMEICICAGKGECVRFDDGEWARSVNCRKIDPKDDAEPLLDHVPCEGDWLEDFKRSMKGKVKEHG